MATESIPETLLPFASLSLATRVCPAAGAGANCRHLTAVRPGLNRVHLPDAPGAQQRGGQASPAASLSRTPAIAPICQPNAHQRRRGFRPWQLPLAGGALVVGLVRAVASRIAGDSPSTSSSPAEQLLQGGRVFPSLLLRHAGGDAPAARATLQPARSPRLVWFRSDLRLHDHEPLATAVADGCALLPVYCFDPREYGKAPSGFDKTGLYRACFMLDALRDLRCRLRTAGSDLVVRAGRPEDVLPALAHATGAGVVYCHAEVTAEEQRVEAAVARALRAHNCALRTFWGGATLLHVDDLPFALDAMPRSYGEFRGRARGCAVRAPMAAPQQLEGLLPGSLEPGELPTLEQLGFSTEALIRCGALGAGPVGGESEALRHLAAFVQQLRQGLRKVADSKEQKEQEEDEEVKLNDGSNVATQAAISLAASNFSCRISPWLAMGCLSPRELFTRLQHECQGASSTQLQQLQREGDQPGIAWLMFELLWRDFFRFVAKRYAHTGIGGHHHITAPASYALAAS